MKLDIISYHDLKDSKNTDSHRALENALLRNGIVGISHVPTFQEKSRAYINAAIQFSALSNEIKQQYAPNRDAGDTEGYEQGAEKFQNEDGVWQIDDKKVSYYAFVPDDPRNKWPREMDFKTPYLALGGLIFETGKLLLNIMGLNEEIGLSHHLIKGYGRMLHYRKINTENNANTDWCGAHYDHGLFTGLMPAYYFCDGKEIDEPVDAGLYVETNRANDYEKVYVPDKSIMLFQVGEFGQIVSHDRIRATKHLVKQAGSGIERYAFALFNQAHDDFIIKSNSVLAKDHRYSQNQFDDGSISYQKWNAASFERYRAK